jgi:hypothetical protein
MEFVTWREIGDEAAVGTIVTLAFSRGKLRFAIEPMGAPMCPQLIQLEKVFCWTTLAESLSSGR